MSVVDGADRIDVALDEIAAVIAQPRPTNLPDQIVVSLACMSLWHVVFDAAMQRADAELARVAAREWAHARTTYRTLMALSPPA